MTNTTIEEQDADGVIHLAFQHDVAFSGGVQDAAADAPASSALTREVLKWQPTHPGLVADLDQGHYFANAR